MTKAEFVECLKANGYSPINDDGCIMICTKSKFDMRKIVKLATKNGFDGSYGWRLKREGNVVEGQANDLQVLREEIEREGKEEA